MRQLFFTFFCYYFLIPCWGQQIESLNPDLEVKDVLIEREVYNKLQGTKGIRFSFAYYLKSETSNRIPIVNDVRFLKNETEVYADDMEILAFRANRWSTAQKFIPYREIDLPSGRHDNVELLYNIKGFLNIKDTLIFEQPTRMAIELEVHGGSVKERLKEWDSGPNIAEWAPDPYWSFTTNKGEKNLVRSKDTSNTFGLCQEIVRFYILEGEELYWHFYDEDGAVDQKLGTYEMFKAKGDFKKRFYGQMFDNIKGLEFTFSQKQLAKQPINIYLRQEYTYKGRTGLRVDVEYDLARAYLGEWAVGKLWLEDKELNRLEDPYCYPLDGTPGTDERIRIDAIRGKMAYFIPFYVWDSNTKQIRFTFETDKKQAADAAPFILQKPITFYRPLVYSGFEVDENYKYKGATGLKIRAYYNVNEINQYSPLQIKFMKKDKRLVDFGVYRMDKSNKLNQVGESSLVIKQPKQTDTLDFFIPYLDINTEELRVEIGMQPDIEIPIVREKTGKLDLERKIYDARIELEEAVPEYCEGDFGYICKIKCATPEFFLHRSYLDVVVNVNGIDFQGYRLASEIADTTRASAVLRGDSGLVSVVIPYRKLKANDEIEITFQTLTLADRAMSDTSKFYWKAPATLNNFEVLFELKTMKFEESLAEDKDFPWRYKIAIGTEKKINRTLVYEYKGKEVREQYSKQAFLHREDKISILLEHKKNPEKKIFIWSGDLGKFQQAKYKAILEDKKPIKKVLVKAKILK